MIGFQESVLLIAGKVSPLQSESVKIKKKKTMAPKNHVAVFHQGVFILFF